MQSFPQSANIIDLRPDDLAMALSVLPWVFTLAGTRMLTDNWRDAVGLWFVLGSFLWALS